ncbi:hypothetical protein CMESO_485 (nucleomorph) [Chroomonas mesostigmatica CCMP1168]|uniref:Ssl1-like domain-containing protein n=1 Tax=Chroomonas mesostigmatica CCMP1168 TaxID=1195612 RepID=J7GB44_9CRYP|nr:hypothetical protein CMESO_485 [Chroomonas mesostigmatica CCMP1168]
MVSQKIIIVNLSFDELYDNIAFDLNQNIFKLVSKLIHYFLYSNPSYQLAIILVKNNSIEQISHLSGNKKHHNQGLYRIKKKQDLGENSLKTAFFLAKKLLSFNKKKSEQEIIIFMGGSYVSSVFHSFGSFFVKNKIKFSVIMFYEKTFLFETLVKITGGFYIVLKKDSNFDLISCMRLNMFRKTQIPKKVYFAIGNFRSKFFFKFSSLNNFKILYGNLKTYCARCNFRNKKIINNVCSNCLILNSLSLIVLKNKKKKKFSFHFLNFLEKKFSLFSILSIKKKTFLYKITQKSFLGNIKKNIFASFFPHYPYFSDKKNIFHKTNENFKNEIFTFK